MNIKIIFFYFRLTITAKSNKKVFNIHDNIGKIGDMAPLEPSRTIKGNIGEHHEKCGCSDDITESVAANKSVNADRVNKNDEMTESIIKVGAFKKSRFSFGNKKGSYTFSIKDGHNSSKIIHGVRFIKTDAELGGNRIISEGNQLSDDVLQKTGFENKINQQIQSKNATDAVVSTNNVQEVNENNNKHDSCLSLGFTLGKLKRRFVKILRRE